MAVSPGRHGAVRDQGRRSPGVIRGSGAGQRGEGVGDHVAEGIAAHREAQRRRQRVLLAALDRGGEVAQGLVRHGLLAALAHRHVTAVGPRAQQAEPGGGVDRQLHALGRRQEAAVPHVEWEGQRVTRRLVQHFGGLGHPQFRPAVGEGEAVPGDGGVRRGAGDGHRAGRAGGRAGLRQQGEGVEIRAGNRDVDRAEVPRTVFRRRRHRETGHPRQVDGQADVVRRAAGDLQPVGQDRAGRLRRHGELVLGEENLHLWCGVRRVGAGLPRADHPRHQCHRTCRQRDKPSP